MSRRWTCLALALITALVYLNSLPGAFHFDDFPLLLESDHTTGPAFSYTSFLDQYGGRPLTLWTLFWNYHLFGDNPLSYHLFSILLHVLVVVQVFLLILQSFGDRATAFFSALLFAIHPLQTQAVNYIWSRSVLLMAALGLLALILSRRRPWMALLCFQLAVWARFEGIVFALPLLLLRRLNWKPLALLIVANAGSMLYSLVKYAPRDTGWAHPDPVGYWLVQFAAFWKYLSLMFWPLGLNLDHDLNPAIVWILLAAFALATLCVSAFFLRHRYPILAVAALWIVVMLSPSLLVPNADTVNESRAYVAMAGFCLAMGWTLSRFLADSSRKLKYGVVAGLLLFLLPVTLMRNQTWNDDVLLWQDAVAKSPNKGRPHYNLGAALARQGKTVPAQFEFEIARTIDPQDDLSYAALGYCAEIRSELEAARDLYRRALRINPNNRYAQQGARRVEKLTEG